MSRIRQKSFDDLCKEDARPGYSWDCAAVIKYKTINKATIIGLQKIKNLIKKINRGWNGRSVEKLYIGKSYITSISKKNHPSRIPYWSLKSGISGRFYHHLHEDHGRNGLVVIAFITEKSIPQACKEDGYITHQEEYALTLEKRLIQKCQNDIQLCTKLANKSTNSGKTNEERSPAYAVYMTFTMCKEKLWCVHNAIWCIIPQVI